MGKHRRGHTYEMDVTGETVERAPNSAVVGDICIALGAGHGEGVSSIGTVVDNVVRPTSLDHTAIHSAHVVESV